MRLFVSLWHPQQKGAVSYSLEMTVSLLLSLSLSPVSVLAIALLTLEALRLCPSLLCLAVTQDSSPVERDVKN
jgi:hypothetical protein